MHIFRGIRMVVVRMMMRATCHCEVRATCFQEGGVPTRPISISIVWRKYEQWDNDEGFQTMGSHCESPTVLVGNCHWLGDVRRVLISGDETCMSPTLKLIHVYQRGHHVSQIIPRALFSFSSSLTPCCQSVSPAAPHSLVFEVWRSYHYLLIPRQIPAFSRISHFCWDGLRRWHVALWSCLLVRGNLFGER